MHTERYPTGLRWASDRAGEGAARPASRQGRTRAHPQRVTTTVPRSGHQLHRHGPALRGGRGVQTHAVPALHRQGRADRRIPTPIRSRHRARGVRPHRPRTSGATPRRLRHALAPVSVHRGGRRNPGPGPSSTCTRPRLQEGFAARLTDTAREAGATDPEQLGEQLALLLDGASARSRVLNTETLATAAAIAAVLVDNAIPTAAPGGESAVEQHGQDGDDAGPVGASFASLAAARLLEAPAEQQ